MGKRVIIAKTAGFCVGVKRAVEMTLDLLEKTKDPVFMYGALIHNPQVTQLLNQKGVKIIDKDSIPKKGTVIIRAHGITPDMEECLRNSKVQVLDATCPFVTRVQKIISEHAQQGFFIVIIGDKGHAEVEGYLGYAKGKGIVIDSVGEITKIPLTARLCIVAQTTQSKKQFDDIVLMIKENYPKTTITIHNTICHATTQRQEETVALARQVDVMIVIGGKNSANTRRLVSLCNAAGRKTYLVERPEDLPLAEIGRLATVGVTAGASTPQWVIDAVVENIKA